MPKPAKAADPATPPWACPSCSTTLATPHCPTCGEQAPHPKDLTLLGLLHHLFHTLTSVDSRLLRSLRALATRPGLLTNAYLQGPRKPYIGPFELFLIVNVVFFAVQSFSGSAIFSTTLHSHLHGQDWSSLAQDLVNRKLAATQVPLAKYEPVFDHAVEINAKALVIVMVLPFALLLIPLFHGSGRPFVTHLVFALHFYSFLLLCFCALLLITLVESWSGGSGLRSTALDWGLFVALLLAGGIYLYISTARVYGAKGGSRALKLVLLIAAVGAAVPGYRFLIFLITLNST